MTLGKPFSVTVNESWIAGNYQLGDIQADFAQYQSLAFEYKTYLSINLIGKKQNLIRSQISKNAAYAGQLKEINGLVNKEMSYVRKGYERDSILYSTKTIATGDIEKSARTFLQGKQSKLSSDANITSAELQVMQSRQQLTELDMQRQNEIEEYERKLGKSRQELIAAIEKWKENYALIAPVAGKMTFINYWSNNQRITSGDRLASIVPDDNVKVIGRLSVPPSGFGKVKDGQRVLVALEGYPYMEFGKLSGIITSISAVPDKDNNYQVEVYFPEGLRTTYKKNISLIQQMKGTGEIITEDMRLIEQLINPIRSLFKNNYIKYLEIGNRYIRYHSYLGEQRDSLYSVTVNVNFDWRSKLGIEREYYPDLEDVYFNFHSNGNLFLTSLVLNYDYCYEETIPVINWNLEPNKDTTIIGHHCLFATAQYCGRHYNAWFAPDIPIKYGPYKFNGLPGLIMKISDYDGFFDWVAVGITTPKRIKNIYFDQAPHVVKTDRSGYRKVFDMQWKDIGTLYRSQGSNLYVGGHGYLQPGENIDIPQIPAIENE
jgi:GLPGLI family protein